MWSVPAHCRRSRGVSSLERWPLGPRSPRAECTQERYAKPKPQSRYTPHFAFFDFSERRQTDDKTHHSPGAQEVSPNIWSESQKKKSTGTTLAEQHFKKVQNKRLIGNHQSAGEGKELLWRCGLMLLYFIFIFCVNCLLFFYFFLFIVTLKI